MVTTAGILLLFISALPFVCRQGLDTRHPEGSGASAARNPDRIPISVVFGEPPGIDGTLYVGAEHGDVIIHAELAGRPFCALVLTTDAALRLSLQLCAHVVDERRRPS